MAVAAQVLKGWRQGSGCLAISRKQGKTRENKRKQACHGEKMRKASFFLVPCALCQCQAALAHVPR